MQYCDKTVFETWIESQQIVVVIIVINANTNLRYATLAWHNSSIAFCLLYFLMAGSSHWKHDTNTNSSQDKLILKANSLKDNEIQLTLGKIYKYQTSHCRLNSFQEAADS